MRPLTPLTVMVLTALLSAGTSDAADHATALTISSRVDAVFAGWNRQDSPGCALAVMRDGRISYEHAYGMADLDHGVPLTPQSVFHVASVSKQFTAASIVLLAQRGQISLDDDVHKYVPELAPFAAPITIRQLLHHTSGLRDQWELLELAGWRYGRDLITDDDVLSVVTRQRELNFQPGERHLYSNTGYTLLALIVARVSHQSFREFTTQNLFAPLGMTHTHFRDDHAEVIRNNAYGYEREKPDAPFRLSVTNFDTVGATSLHTTVEDLARWDANFLNPRVGGEAFLAQMLERGRLTSDEEIDYASGLMHSEFQGLKTVGHGGSDAGYRADFTRFPVQRFAVAVLCNAAEADPAGLGRRVAEIYLAQDIRAVRRAAGNTASEGPVPVLGEEQLRRFAGKYWDRASDQFVDMVVKDGQLRQRDGDLTDDDRRLTPDSASSFHWSATPNSPRVSYQFKPSPEAGQQLRITVGTRMPRVLEAVDAVHPSVGELAEYAGTYTAAELEIPYELALQEGRLTIRWLKHPPAALRAAARDVFAGEAGTVRFRRDDAGHVDGFELNSDRISHLRFDRRGR